MSGGLRLGIAGAAGRMGTALVRAAVATDGCRLTAALEAPGHPAIGEDALARAGLAAAGVSIGDSEEAFLAAADAVIDFTVPESTAARAGAAAGRGVAFVAGTTGLGDGEMNALRRAGEKVPVVWAPNMSVGVSLLLHLVRSAAGALGPEWDIEIAEMHHRDKRDAPSGTALALGAAAAAGRGADPRASAVRARDGDTGPRKEGTIGYAVLRGGDVAGDHLVTFAGTGERLELGHRATDRAIFARGAVRAALWAAGREPGLYGMDDVLGLAP